MKKTIKVVGAIIRDDSNRVLCALRSSQMSLPNLWEFPGGKIEEGEQPEESLCREIREELSCDIEVAGMVEDTTHDYGGFIINLRTFHAKVVGGEPVASEHAALLWLPVSSLQSLVWAPADIPAVDRLVVQQQEAATLS